MALYLGVNRSTVSRIENGQSCSGSVRRLLEMLNRNASITDDGIARPVVDAGVPVVGACVDARQSGRGQGQEEGLR